MISVEEQLWREIESLKRKLISLGTQDLINSVPIGVIAPFGAATAPVGWLLCDGSAVSRTTYAALFALISTTYGVGDGSTTFNVPDLRGRFPVGLGTHTDVDVLGDNDGAALASRTPKHTHTGPNHTHTGPSHTHPQNTDGQITDYIGSGSDVIAHQTAPGRFKVPNVGGATTVDRMARGVAADGTGATGPGGTGASGSAGGSWVVVNFIIKT